VTLVLMADEADQLKASDEQIAAHKRLVEQADRLFGARPFAHYDFLLALTDELGGIGLEHQQSSENSASPRYFGDWDKAVGARELLPHEYAHAWNGKYRRPADLATPHFNTPMGNSLLWLYEGQTEFWGKVLAARAGLVKPELTRDELAGDAAWVQARVGRAWRNLQDTVHEPIINDSWRRDWPDWQRQRVDYYTEAVLVWLEADALIRELSGGARSLDDFARAFFGADGAGPPGNIGPRTYTFDDVVAALHNVQPHDWADFLRARLDGPAESPLEGLKRAGWALAFTDKPSPNQEARAARWGPSLDLTYSLGLRLGGDGQVQSVGWDSPAFKAGLAPGMQIVAVRMRAYKADVLKAAISANKDGKAPIELLVKEGDSFRQLRIDYRGGLRYPSLVRLEGTPDRLTPLLMPR
jgi:predicted metalloprotease with PDZ domain